MSMTPRDKRMVGIGVVCLLISMSGIAFATGPLDAPGNLLPDYIADWYTGSDSDSETGLNDQVVTMDVRDHNLTRVTVRLSWTDDEFVGPIGRRDDTLTLHVEGPSALDQGPQEMTGTSGELLVVFDLESVPTDDDMDHFEDHDYTNATGDWSITVSVQPAGLRDSGNDWTVTFSYEFYVGRLIQNPGVV
jgi:hypothetical protein